MKPRAGTPLALFGELEPNGGAPLYRRAYARLGRMILDGALAPGSRLPSARTLAADLRVSRNTIEAAFAQLATEGYVVRRVGSGTFVCAALPQSVRGARRLRPADGGGAARAIVRRAAGVAALSRRGRLAASPGPDPRADQDATFGVCRPGLDVFPLRTWNRLVARHARCATRDLLDECPPAGLPGLRRAIAGYLVAARGVRCDAEQVIVLTSTQQAIDLAARLLLDPGQAAWIEEPCYTGARLALESAGARIVAVAVNDDGLDVARGRRAAPHARLAYVTPSHQFPLGMTMPLERRLELLRWAKDAGPWIIEDDYDSEFRYGGRPLAALQGLDTSGRVLYAGTFNKVMFPSLRLAYLIVPPDLVDAFASARRWIDGHCSALTQAAMADFIERGHFGAHVRRMREIYRERRDALRDAIAAHAGSRIRLGPDDAGMHVVGWLPSRTDVGALAERAAAHGLYLRDLAVYYAGRPPAPGLVLNFSSAPPRAIRRGVAVLSSLL